MATLKLLGEANEALTEGNAALENKQFTEAVMAFRSGLRCLGDHYLGERPTLDSTSTRITLARVEERKGNLSVAAHLLRNALSTRTAMMEAKLAVQAGPDQTKGSP